MRRNPVRCGPTGKVRYRTHDIALLALVEVVFDLEGHEPDRSKVPCRTYQCPKCDGWHLTAMPLMEVLTPLPQRVDSQQVSRDTDHRTGTHHGTH